MTLAEMAPHPSVTVGVLASREEAFPEGRLHRPPVTRLGGTEAPAYVLTNEKRGIGLGTKRNTTKPSGDRGTAVVVTDRRTLCLVGGGEEDSVIEVPHDSVVEASYHTGLLANRFVLRTPRKQYHCWAKRSTSESLLSAAAEYVEERTSETPDEIETDDGANQLTYRGQPISRENHPGVPDEPPADSAESDGADSDGDESRDRSDATSAEDGDDSRIQYRGKTIDRSGN
ncbi:hypothetical protein C475_14958 [Halosimplex carlsbadense 2-9-1]|uniref:Uncharacterized protein n=2 Tax=Halosimplex carlsbadense TaxID=171164 RepID=M0CK29_9EURY|nr:hypothetical protein C475_14958 [Halosimplex carlsbadense 2-9-1]